MPVCDPGFGLFSPVFVSEGSWTLNTCLVDVTLETFCFFILFCGVVHRLVWIYYQRRNHASSRIEPNEISMVETMAPGDYPQAENDEASGCQPSTSGDARPPVQSMHDFTSTTWSPPKWQRWTNCTLTLGLLASCTLLACTSPAWKGSRPLHPLLGDFIRVGEYLLIFLVLVVEHDQGRPRAFARAVRAWLLVALLMTIVRLRSVLKLLDGDYEGKAFVWLRLLEMGMIFCLTLFGLHQREGPSSTFDPREVAENSEQGNSGMQQSQEYAGSLWTKLTFSWLNPLLMTGATRPLQESHLYDLEPIYTPSENAERLRAAWNSELERKGKAKTYVTNALYKSGLAKSFWIAGIIYSVGIAGSFMGPLLLGQLIEFVEKPIDNMAGYTAAALLFFSQVTNNMCNVHYNWRMSRLGLMARGGCSCMVFEKSLRLTPDSLASYGIGSLVNIMQIDCMRLSFGAYFIHFIWAMPLQLAIALYLIYRQVHWAGFAAIGVMVLMAPLNGLIAKRFMNIQIAINTARDSRVKLLTEMVHGIKLVKLLAWESKICDLLNKKREEELEHITRMKYTGLMAGIAWTLTPILLPLVTFGVFVLVGGQLTASVAFTTLALLDVLRVPVNLIPQTIQFLTQMAVGMKRISDLLKAEEVSEVVIGGPGASVAQAISTNDRARDPLLDGAADAPLVPNEYRRCLEPRGDIAVRVRGGSFIWKEVVPIDMGKGKGGGKGKGKGKGEGKSNGKGKGNHEGNSAVGGAGEVGEGNGKGKGKEMSRGSAATSTGSRENDGASETTNAPQGITGVDVTIPPGALVFVIGRVGAGKSTFLAGLLNEVNREAGTVEVNGKVAYCPQQAWIKNGSIRENILFDAPFNKRRYEEVAHSCALDADFDQLDEGDETIIGERGINISGGQKQRVSLARAVYSGSDILILDDVLSAVDAHVAQHLMEKCIAGAPDGSKRPILRDRTRILVTHQIHYAHLADFVAVIEDGKLKAFGTPKDLQSKGIGDLSKYVNAELCGTDAPPSEQVLERGTTPVLTREISEETKESSGKEKKKEKPKQLMQEEDRETGGVSMKVWSTYVIVLGASMVSMLFIAYVIGNGLQVAGTFCLATWSGDPGSTNQMWYLGIYTAVMLSSGASVFVRQIIGLIASVRASRKLHKDAIHALFKSPMSFFDTTPTGRIINRLSSDLQKVDLVLQGNMQFFLMAGFNLIFGIIAVFYQAPWAVLVVIPMPFAYYHIQKCYRASSRELQRIESISKTPIFQEFDEALQGVSTIRSWRAINRFGRGSEEKMQRNLRVTYLLSGTSFWLSIRLGIIGNVIVAAVAFLAIMQGHSPMSAGLVGFGLKYALQVTEMLSSFLQSFTNVEIALISMERMAAYAKLTPEEDGRASVQQVRSTTEIWPSVGAISFNNATMSYRPGLDPVLKGIDVQIYGGQSVGIVGRTGAGKSSLLVALFRLADLSSGSIAIDGRNIAEVDLNSLRSSIAIIPQDPVLFSGTLRFNLDPFDECEDFMLLDMLGKVELLEFVQNKEDGLLMTVMARGENLSVGQRQLICLARALLRKARILVLDEATASVDNQTDELIQRTLHDQAKENKMTVLTIAHRIHTILQHDMVLLMDDGKAAEFGRVEDLQRNPVSKFRALCDDAGVNK